jgi:L-asparaginase
MLNVVTCGGTIAMTTGADGVRRPADSAQVAALLSDLAGCPTTAASAGELDSSQAVPSDWSQILSTVRATQDHGPCPVVVTHGTDTLAWTAGMLAAAGHWKAPVVLTGANIPLGDPGSDAETNLRTALAAARSGIAGVHVAFAGSPDAAGEVFQGGFVRKTQAGGRAFAGLPARFGRIERGELKPERP